MDFFINTGLFSIDQNFKQFDPEEIYDTIIIGGGPAGVTAAIYSMRKGMSAGIIAKKLGGQVAETAGIENYLGYRYINGMELVDKFREQVFQFGIAYEADMGVKAITDGAVKEIKLDDGRLLKARTVIIASGKQYKKLGLPNEVALTGRGVAYCSICDAPLYEGKKVIIAGGGNSGMGAAIDLAKLASHVTVVQKRDRLTGDKILNDKLKEFSNIDYLFEHLVTGINGIDKVTGVDILDIKKGETIKYEADGIFVEIGLIPNSDFVKGVVELNIYNEIIIDSRCRTDKPGIFAAGDVTDVPYKQIVVASGEGAKAALSAYDYILNKNGGF